MNILWTAQMQASGVSKQAAALLCSACDRQRIEPTQAGGFARAIKMMTGGGALGEAAVATMELGSTDGGSREGWFFRGESKHAQSQDFCSDRTGDGEESRSVHQVSPQATLWSNFQGPRASGCD